MKIKHHEIIPNEEKPFAECKLGREPYARVLTDIVNTYADGFVLAINNEWGTGKTTFVKMWQQQLKNEGFQTIYFNAWENDFDSNPLVAMMSELETLTNANNKKVFKSVVEKGAVLVKNIVPALAKSLIKKYVVDVDDITVEAIENATKASTEILEKEIKEYADKKKTIIDFRKELEKFVKQADNAKPLIFIVDELDRCRPNYSVEVLEQIKHFFSVSGIVFVLSIDKKHLGASVKGYYGSEQIDSNEYLRRFIDLEYSIPRPSIKAFVNYLFEYYSIKEILSSPERIKFPELSRDSQNFLEFATFLFTKSNPTLRQQEKIFALTRLILCSFKNNQYIFPDLLFFLIFLKVMKPDLYDNILDDKYTLQEISNLYDEFFIQENKYDIGRHIFYVGALLLWFYNNEREYARSSDLLLQGDDGKPLTTITSKIAMDNFNLARLFEIIRRERFNDMKIGYLLEKINLNEPLDMIN